MAAVGVERRDCLAFVVTSQSLLEMDVLPLVCLLKQRLYYVTYDFG